MQQICHVDQQTQHSQFGYVIVEANFKLFLKTSSRLKIAIVSLFARIDACLPDLVVCSLTQRSVRKAFVHGITAKQILQFLKDHAHRLMTAPHEDSDKEGLPRNVLEQIELWEGSRQRISISKAVLYDRFESPELFAATVKYSQDLQAHLWSTPPKDHGDAAEDNTLLATLDAHPNIRRFVVDKKTEAEESLYD